MDEIRNVFIPMIVDVAQQNAYANFDPSWLQALLEQLREHINKHYKRPEGQYSKVRKLISAEISRPEILAQVRSVIKMTKDQFELANHIASKVLERKNAKQTVISFEFVGRVIEQVRQCISFADKVIFLQLACGARKIELLDENTSKFRAVENQRRLIEQVGFAKKHASSEVSSIIKPLLWVDSWNFLECLEEIRLEVRSREKEEKRDIAKSFSTQLEKRCKFLWPQHVGNGYATGTHLNRAIYANVAYRFRKTAGESLTHFIKHQLGHDSMGSAANYMNVAIAFSEDESLLNEALWQEGDSDLRGVNFETAKGGNAMLPYPAIRQLSKEQRFKELDGYSDVMSLRDIPVTRVNLMRLGFQSSLIKEWFLQFK